MSTNALSALPCKRAHKLRASTTHAHTRYDIFECNVDDEPPTREPRVHVAHVCGAHVRVCVCAGGNLRAAAACRVSYPDAILFCVISFIGNAYMLHREHREHKKNAPTRPKPNGACNLKSTALNPLPDATDKTYYFTA